MNRTHPSHPTRSTPFSTRCGIPENEGKETRMSLIVTILVIILLVALILAVLGRL